MSANIDLLLKYLHRGNMAYELVILLQQASPNQWSEILKKYFDTRIGRKVERLRNATNQATGN